MANYAFDYLSSPGSLPFTTAATELSAFMVTQRRNIALENFIFMVATVNHWIIHRRDTGMSNQQNGKIHARKVNWGWIYLKGLGVRPDTRKSNSLV